MQLKKVLASNPYSRSAEGLAPKKKEEEKKTPPKGSSGPQSVTAYKVLPGKQMEEMGRSLGKTLARISQSNLKTSGETARRYAKRSGGKSR